MPNDRFEKMVDRATSGDPGMKNGLRLGHDEVVAVLCRQHAAYVRMVKKMPCLYADASGICGRPAPRICKLSRGQLLDAFARYKKGTR